MIFRNRNYPRAYTPDMVFEELEARIVLDASVDHVTGHDSIDPAQSLHDFQQVAPSAASAASDVQPDPHAAHASGLDLVLISDSVRNADSIAQAAVDDATVIVYDADTANLHSLVESLVVMMDATGDHISNLAIVDHAQAGRIHVGTDTIDSSNIAQHSADLDNLKAALTPDGQIQLFGCSLAENDAGKALVNAVALHTAADVYASVDNTGSPSGDWELEYGSNASAVPSEMLHLASVATIDTHLAETPPTIDTPPPQPPAVGEGTTGPLTYGGLITISNDPVDEDVLVTLTAATEFEYILVGDPDGVGGVTVTPDAGDPDHIYYILGTAAEVNPALATLTASLLAGTAPGSYDIVIEAVEQTAPNGAAPPGALTQTVLADNQPPAIAAPATAIVAEDVDTPVGPISITDPDIGLNTMLVQLQVYPEGTLSMTTTTGLLFFVGDGNNDAQMLFTGTQADVNAALATLTYLNTTGLNPNPQSLQIDVDDQGYTGAGGAQQATWTVDIDVNPFNNDHAINAPANASMFANQQLLFYGVNGVSISDEDAGTHADLEVTLSAPLGGDITLTDTTGLTFTPPSDGYQDTTMTFSGSLDALNNALGGIIYRTYPTLPAFYTGPAQIDITYDDQGWSEGGVQGASAPVSATINILVEEPTFWGRWPREVCS